LSTTSLIHVSFYYAATCMNETQQDEGTSQNNCHHYCVKKNINSKGTFLEYGGVVSIKSMGVVV